MTPLGADLAGYQGQPGSFSARAAARCGKPVAFPTFERMLRALLAGETACAVLPAVNRADGPILESLDALARSLLERASALAVEAEIEVSVRLVLAAPEGLALEGVREVHSQAAVLRQCRNLLARLDAIPIDTHDTAYAAFRVKEAGGPRAAVCSEEAALEAGLLILEEDVSDVRPNTTRFWRLARAGAAPEVLPETDAPPDAPAPRVVFYAGVKASSALAEAGAELLSLPGTPADPVRGFAVVPEKNVARTSALTGLPAASERVIWLGPTPEFVRPPRMRDIPKVTEVREPSVVAVGPFVVGGGRRAVIAGPCAVESPEQVARLARAVARAGATALRGGVFKPRTSPYSFQGHGLDALGWLKDAGDAAGLPIVTEVMAPAQVVPVAERADVLQIGARNCQNYDLLREAGKSSRPVFLKRGFGTTVEEWLSSAEYLLDAGCRNVILCERGIRTFEKATRGTLDLGGLLAARSLTHLPLFADPSHAAGRRDLVPGLARAAWGAGVDGLMIEVHDAPESALSDGPQALLPEDLEELLDEFGILPGASGSVERIRRAIDVVDGGIARLAAQRLELARRVGAVKKATGRPIRDEAREASVRARFAEALGGDSPCATRLADTLIDLALEAEKPGDE
ncbi:MAG TPA: 3-deoxy-7-phosphoheptulonate synthase [Thermoanaerobaculia bacterium]|nr:3-deoxy-7-phosphoheptulonate synthase [Thermoanaerobaculia bacterium]